MRGNNDTKFQQQSQCLLKHCIAIPSPAGSCQVQNEYLSYINVKEYITATFSHPLTVCMWILNSAGFV
jgi:hypothetical protein